MAHRVQALTPEMTGRWWVRTQGSEHMFDLDAHTYTRHQLDGLNGMRADGVSMPLPPEAIHWWPTVGRCFLIVVHLPLQDTPHVFGTTRRSSVVRWIEEAE